MDEDCDAVIGQDRPASGRVTAQRCFAPTARPDWVMLEACLRHDAHLADTRGIGSGDAPDIGTTPSLRRGALRASAMKCRENFRDRLYERLDEAIGIANPVRVVDAFIVARDLAEFGFDITPEATGRPSYHPATMLKI